MNRKTSIVFGIFLLCAGLFFLTAFCLSVVYFEPVRKIVASTGFIVVLVLMAVIGCIFMDWGVTAFKYLPKAKS